MTTPGRAALYADTDSSRTDRRNSIRARICLPINLTRGPECPCPGGETVDISQTGLLVRLSGPGGPPYCGDRLFATVSLPDGLLHLLGCANRCVRGDDDRWYVAIALDDVHSEDRQRLERLIAS